MESVLDQYTDDKLETIPEEPIVDNKKVVKRKKAVVKKDEVNTDIEEKREQLSILAVLGTIESYTGQKMSLGDVKKLSSKDVEKYYNRYQVILGNHVTGSLVDTTIETFTELANYMLPIDNKNNLCDDLKSNTLIKQELSNAAGYLVLKGGRFVALASGLLQVAKHVDLKSINKKEPVDDMDKYIQDTVEQTIEIS